MVATDAKQHNGESKITPGPCIRGGGVCNSGHGGGVDGGDGGGGGGNGGDGDGGDGSCA